MGTGGQLTQNLRQVGTTPHEANNNTNAKDTTTLLALQRHTTSYTSGLEFPSGGAAPFASTIGVSQEYITQTQRALKTSHLWNTRVLCVRIKQARCTCFATQKSPKAVWSRRLRNMQVSLCWWSVNCCVQACKQTQRDTQGRKRAKCAHVGDTNNTPPHANRESGVIQTSNRARVWQIWEARKDT